MTDKHNVGGWESLNAMDKLMDDIRNGQAHSVLKADAIMIDVEEYFYDGMEAKTNIGYGPAYAQWVDANNDLKDAIKKLTALEPEINVMFYCTEINQMLEDLKI